MPLVAVVCCVVAVLLLFPGPAPAGRAVREPRSAGASTTRLALAATAVVLVAPTSWWLPGLVVGSAVVGARLLLRRRTARRDEEASRLLVLETCEQLAAELTSGRPPGVALASMADDWPLLAPVAEAFRMGADVPSALREVATRPGADDLRLLAAAWQVSHRTGQGLSSAVERVADDVRRSRASRRLVEGELASARATTRLVAALPVLALAMGSGSGGDPWGFLVGTTPGLACLAAGMCLGFAGLWWIEAIARDVARSG